MASLWVSELKKGKAESTWREGARLQYPAREQFKRSLLPNWVSAVPILGITSLGTPGSQSEREGDSEDSR